MEMNRKEFLQTLGITGTSLAMGGLGALDALAQDAKKEGPVDLVAIRGGEPDVMFRKAIAELGGMQRFVQKGQKVVIKPNIGWDKTPEMAANTNPDLVAEMVRQCIDAGAAEVIVFDRTCDDMKKCYANSGIEKAAQAAGAKLLPADDERYYQEVELPEGKALKKTKIHHSLIDCDVWFNVPVLKVHVSAKMTIAMKNYMGIIFDRKIFHSSDLHQCIADVCTWHKRPVLNVVDAYRIMKENGPRGKSVADAVLVKALVASSDIVAVDTAATKLAKQFTGVDIDQVGHIGAGEALKLGTTNVETLNVRRIQV